MNTVWGVRASSIQSQIWFSVHFSIYELGFLPVTVSNISPACHLNGWNMKKVFYCRWQDLMSSCTLQHYRDFYKSVSFLLCVKVAGYSIYEQSLFIFLLSVVLFKKLPFQRQLPATVCQSGFNSWLRYSTALLSPLTLNCYRSEPRRISDFDLG